MAALARGAPLQTSNPPELWTFALTNVFTFLLGGILAALAYRAYRREGHQAFLIAAVGFALLTLGTIVELAYDLGVNNIFGGGIAAFGRELLLLRTAEAALLAAGLLLLLYSLRSM